MKYNFEKLEVYQLARNLLIDIYKICSKFPKEELFVLTSQTKRAAISVILNITEGSIKTKKEFARFISIALGSLVELKTCLSIAKDLNYIKETDLLPLISKIDELFFKLIKLNKYLKK